MKWTFQAEWGYGEWVDTTFVYAEALSQAMYALVGMCVLAELEGQ